MESDVCATSRRDSHSGHVLTEEPIGVDGQEAISEAREYGATERCTIGVLALEREACKTAYAKVDPDAFVFVTGAGWIPNGQAAYSKAFFGFFCKQSEDCDLSGHMRFRWGENRFQATKFDRLVVEDDGTATFTGVGTINDSGGYEFMVHISDEPDSIDILIPGEEGYDTGGLVDLGSGRIKIHQWAGWPDILRNN
ncbi:MAG: hypothetical protein P8Z79_15190 [Sedimentisphaerales bacterium]|jgi:hypothetical protein